MRGANQHLSDEEVEQLTGIATDVAVGALEGAMRHLERCEQCRFRMLSVQDLPGDLPTAPAGVKTGTSPCPPEARWLEVAAGLGTPAERKRYIEHAAGCARCGQLLKEALEDIGMELTQEEEAKVAALASARPDWQRNVAQKIASIATPAVQNVEKDVRPSGKFVFWPRWAAAFAALIVATGGGWWAWIQFATPSVETLIEQAYAEKRTIEPRIPGAKYAPMRVERGPGESNVKKRPALLKAEALIAEGLQKNPNDPALLQAKARTDLLDGNYGEAIRSLQLALLSKPDSPQLLTDLGTAYYQAGNYSEAVNKLGDALRRTPEDPIALFNHAIACEKWSLHKEAIADWEHYLRIDPVGGWADEARANLQRIRQELDDKEKQTTTPLLKPAELVAFVDADRKQAVTTLDRRVERYLDAATHSWLPEVYSNNSSQGMLIVTRHALTYLAEILRSQHDDTWLDDFLSHQPDRLQNDALQSLLASDEALKGGRYGLSIDLAEKSVREFRHSGNQAGMLRASFALMLAESFALNPTDCLKTAAIAIPLLSATAYRWLQIQSLIQQGQCQYATVHVDDALFSTSRATELAKSFRYPGLELRAMAFAAVDRSQTGTADGGLNDLMSGLATFWKTDAINTRGENLYSVLFEIASARNWHHLEALALAEKIADFPDKDPVDEAVSWQLLAGAEERAGDYDTAQAILRRAETKLAALPEDSGVSLRKAEIKLESAGMDLHLGNPQAALAVLASLSQQFETPNGLFQTRYFKTYGEAYLALGQYDSAGPLLQRALSISETGLRGLRLETDRLQWSRTQNEIYRDFLEIKLKTGTPAEALALWEWYKSASLPVASADNNRELANAASHSSASSESSFFGLPTGTALVSYAVLRNSATAFILRDGLVQTRALSLTGTTEQRIMRFLSLCADPSTDINSVRSESRFLYDAFIAPLESDIQGALVLRFETDGMLDHVPFDLLRSPDGRYLADHYEITYSPGQSYGSRARFDSLSPASTALIVVPEEMQEPSLASLPEAVEEAKDVATYFSSVKILSGSDAVRENVLRNLRDAEVFHFVGHAQTIVDQVGLVLGPGALLSSHDLANLRPLKVRLAVLSACETALGDEGTFSDVNSIARTLAVAGVRQIVASRWKVDSAVTSKLMREFYSSLMSGKSPADSLRIASSVIRSLPRYQHPYYWGSFAVFGG